MKNVLIILACFFALGSMTSCKKDWTCECSTATGTDSVAFTLKALRTNDAKVKCRDYGDFIGQCAIK